MNQFLLSEKIARLTNEIGWQFYYRRDNWHAVQRLMMTSRVPLSDLINLHYTLLVGQALCHRCVGIPVREASTPISNSAGTKGGGHADPGACAGCGNQLREGQALVALDRQWHVWCFKCHSCDTVLHGEYMGKWVSRSSKYIIASWSSTDIILFEKFFYELGIKIR